MNRKCHAGGCPKRIPRSRLQGSNGGGHAGRPAKYCSDLCRRREEMRRWRAKKKEEAK